MNLNAMARIITLKEGKKVNLTVAQVKEVMKLTLAELAQYNDEQILETVKKFK